MSAPDSLPQPSSSEPANGQPVRSPTGRLLEDIHLDAVMSGDVSAEDLRIHSHTLQTQARISRQSGYDRLAENLERASELTRVPNEALLAMYEALRPGRSTYDQLVALAESLEEKYGAPSTAKFVREAAEVYRQRGLVWQG